MDADQKALGQRRQAKKRGASSEIIANERNAAFAQHFSIRFPYYLGAWNGLGKLLLFKHAIVVLSINKTYKCLFINPALFSAKAKVEPRAQLQNPFLSAKLFTVIGSVENTLED